MKHLFKNIILTMGVLSLLAINACKDDISPLHEELDYKRVFSPLGLGAAIENQTTVALNWDLTAGAESYVVEISYDSLQFANIIHTATVAEDDLPYSYDLPAGDARFSARVQAVGSSGVESSKWSTITFKSLPENLFEGYSLTMDALNAVTLNWKPGKEVTTIVFDDGSATPPSFDITAAEAAAGKKSVTGVANAAYEIKLMNNVDVRGFQNYAMEGDVLLASGGDLAAVIAAASAGDVIILTGGEQYGFVGDLTIDKSLKIKGLDGQELPVLYITSGDRMFYIGSSLTPADSLVFENLYMSGFDNHNVDDGQHRGVFDMEGEACNLGALKFIGCKLYDMGRQIVRLRGGSDQTIGLYLIDDCIIHNLGKSSRSYGILCATEDNTNVTVFKMINSTVDSIRSHLIRYDEPTSCESIILENCTFNRVPYSSDRYMADLRDAVITDGVYVTNCIFGSTSYGDDPSISGIRVADGVNLTITNSFTTSDFVLTGYDDMNDQVTQLEVASDALWNGSESMDFSFNGEALQAGDPRWK